ncbi:prephenate dehydrogenase/arogenate dehydrogenase family protein [Alicyclobacillus sp. SO9]|uniref:prephenate dehydrogenase n=1 Tax=Alicyclobacillus sp. SO9 TaxID=2665646 RepID=UPI0018E8B50D|nr:prephenate dehydrogenase/arogenate dehydrogenase family protein [Alicyclobacillus sp. SO9]QQE76795.1 prephenate dehydrogenase/arogenate dehydrogenase family protein [Alicyclobacillus sp. SO9]
MQHKDDERCAEFRPRSILIVGCGLIGASAAYALRERLGHACVIDGVEKSEEHRTILLRSGRFTNVFSALPAPEQKYDLAILALPVSTAVQFMHKVSQLADILMDVCSVKLPLCHAAQALHLEERFAPTHPMAGLASEGPLEATADLFTNRSWLTIEGWPAAERLRTLIESIGADFGTVASAEQHDSLMAVVSHGIHLTSLASMLAYQDMKETLPALSAKYCGPGFRDVTRLAASPSGFWTSTLLFNRVQTATHLKKVINELEHFVDVLEQGDEIRLKEALEKSRAARLLWETEKGNTSNV